MARLALLALLLAGAAPLFASPEPARSPDVLRIDGMQPMTAADLTRFTGLAVRLAASAARDPKVEPVLEETLSQADRGIVKRAVSYLALCAMDREPTARRLTGTSFRDRAMLRIVRACLAAQESLTLAPER